MKCLDYERVVERCEVKAVVQRRDGGLLAAVDDQVRMRLEPCNYVGVTEESEREFTGLKASGGHCVIRDRYEDDTFCYRQALLVVVRIRGEHYAVAGGPAL